jgi:hypothetical protein
VLVARERELDDRLQTAHVERRSKARARRQALSSRAGP